MKLIVVDDGLEVGVDGHYWQRWKPADSGWRGAWNFFFMWWENRK